MIIKPIKIKGKKYVRIGERDFIVLTNAEYIRARYRTQDLKRGGLKNVNKTSKGKN